MECEKCEEIEVDGLKEEIKRLEKEVDRLRELVKNQNQKIGRLLEKEAKRWY